MIKYITQTIQKTKICEEYFRKITTIKIQKLKIRKEKEKVEEERKEKKKGISFFKKVWYSTTKFDKYIEMKESCRKKATRYLLKMIIIMAIIIAAIGIYDTNLRLDEGLKYIAQEIPDFKYAEEQLDVEVGEVIKTKEEIFDLGNVIVDTKVE